MKACKNGHTIGRDKYGSCIACGRAATARYRSKNRLKVNAQAARHYHSDPVYRERAKLRRRIENGIPQATRPEPAFCECCAQKPNGRSLVIDHDHETGEFRGWLCYKCNAGIGLLGDSATGIELARRYFLALEFT